MEAAELLTGSVQGTARSPYEVEVYFDVEDDWTDISSNCDCPVGFSCKHAAALLIFWSSKRQAAADDKPAGVIDRRQQQLAAALDNDKPAMQWVDGLVSALSTAEQKPKSLLFPVPADSDRFIYELKRLRVNSGMTLGVRVFRAGTLKNGQPGKGRPYPLDHRYAFLDSMGSAEDEVLLDLSAGDFTASPVQRR